MSLYLISPLGAGPCDFVTFIRYVIIKMLLLRSVPLDINFACEHVRTVFSCIMKLYICDECKHSSSKNILMPFTWNEIQNEIYNTRNTKQIRLLKVRYILFILLTENVYYFDEYKLITHKCILKRKKVNSPPESWSEAGSWQWGWSSCHPPARRWARQEWLRPPRPAPPGQLASSKTNNILG